MKGKEREWKGEQYRIVSYKLNFLYSCKMRSRNLRFRYFSKCQVNIAQSSWFWPPHGR